jgi:phosphoenolpyruvate carboxykinase (GTP)
MVIFYFIKDPEKMKQNLLPLFKDSMKGRTMYIIPFLKGNFGSSFSKFGVEITDSPYVVANTYILSHIGTKVLSSMNKDSNFFECFHSCGKVNPDDLKDLNWPCDVKNLTVAHFPEEMAVWSYGSGTKF